MSGPNTTVAELSWQSLTPAVNEIKSPNKFLKELCFPNHQTMPTETIGVDVLIHLREMAPFVRKNGEAIIVGGHSTQFQTITPPNIRIKHPFVPSELLFTRRAGTPIFITPQEQQQAIQQHIAYDLQIMADDVTNSEEWLCSQVLTTGEISYQVDSGESYQITYPIPSGNILDAAVSWEAADLTTPTIEEDFIIAKRLISVGSCPAPTDVILGLRASVAFRKVIKKQFSGANNPNGLVYLPGDLALEEQYRDDGALFLGRWNGLRVWEYSRQIPLPGANGTFTTVDLVPSTMALFISTSPAAQRVLYYGAIPDINIFGGGAYQTERFAKSWMKEDPAAMWALIHSRPLPALRRPQANVLMTVIF